MIVFTREKPNNVREFWSVNSRGADLKKLDGAPDWYAQAQSSPISRTSNHKTQHRQMRQGHPLNRRHQAHVQLPLTNRQMVRSS
jgi:hypothetical protein